MKQVIPIVPASSGSMWWFGFFCIVMVGLIIFVYYVSLSSRNTRFEVTESGLKIAGNIYGRLLPFKMLKLEDAHPVNLKSQLEFKLKFGTSCTTMPGYRAGWFRSRRGKMFAFITDPTHVLYIPTQNGYGVLISVNEPKAVLEALNKMANARKD